MSKILGILLIIGLFSIVVTLSIREIQELKADLKDSKKRQKLLKKILKMVE